MFSLLLKDLNFLLLFIMINVQLLLFQGRDRQQVSKQTNQNCVNTPMSCAVIVMDETDNSQMKKCTNNVLFLPKTYCGYILEPPYLGSSNEYQKDVF